MNLVLHPRKTVLIDGFLLCLRYLSDLQGTIDYFGGSPGTARLMQHFQNWTEETNKFWSLCLSHLFLLPPNVRRQPLESAGCSPGLEDIFREPLGTLYQFHAPLLRSSASFLCVQRLRKSAKKLIFRHAGVSMTDAALRGSLRSAIVGFFFARFTLCASATFRRRPSIKTPISAPAAPGPAI